MGLPAEVIASLEEEDQGASGFGVWRRNWDIVMAFLAIASQWRIVTVPGAGVYWHGLDYAAAGKGLELAGISVSPTQWKGVRLMEAEAREALNGYRG